MSTTLYSMAGVAAAVGAGSILAEWSYLRGKDANFPLHRDNFLSYDIRTLPLVLSSAALFLILAKIEKLNPKAVFFCLPLNFYSLGVKAFKYSYLGNNLPFDGDEVSKGAAKQDQFTMTLLKIYHLVYSILAVYLLIRKRPT